MTTKRKAAAKPEPATETVKPSVTRLIRELVVKDEALSVDEIMAELGDLKTTKATVYTARFHVLATLAVLRDLGLLKVPPRRRSGNVSEPVSMRIDTAETAA